VYPFKLSVVGQTLTRCHPERSASKNCFYKGEWRVAEGPRKCLYRKCRIKAFSQENLALNLYGSM